MATIISLQSRRYALAPSEGAARRRASRQSPAINGDDAHPPVEASPSAEIVVFPGIRYERTASDADPEMAQNRPTVARDWLVLTTVMEIESELEIDEEL